MKYQWQEVTEITQHLAPAKLNLFLQVFNEKIGNYHNLQSLMVPIDLHDTITFMPHRDCGTVSYSFAPNLGEPDKLQRHIAQNCIVTKAWHAFHAAAQVPPLECAVHVHKNIPIQAGLGGGSSNAATVLLALNQLLNIPLPEQVMLEIAIKLGADVPFFYGQKASVVLGIGEILFPLALPQKWFVLIYPKLPISTQEAFTNLVSYSPYDQKYKIPATYFENSQQYLAEKDMNTSFNTFQHNVVIDNSLLNVDDSVIQRTFHNVLTNQENSFMDKLLALATKLKKIYELSNYSCRISGTGSTMFIECNDKNQALSDHEKLSKLFKKNDVDCTVYVVKSF